ncbi:MAG: hypothetical protein IJ302_00665, partial [Clostridia bacterium]|nr:hypothetical protein [Clostridia bacterium]
MKNTNHLFALASALLILLCACSDTGGAETKTSDTASGTTTAVTEQPDYVLPTLDYEGEAFSMLVGEGYNECFVEEETGEALDDAKWQMQRTVEEALNVTISETPTDFWEMSATVNTYIMSGETTYDAIAMMDRFALNAALENSFIPIQDVTTINTDAVYWGGELSSRLSIGGNEYFAIGSQNLESFSKTACILWNMNLANTLGLEIPYEDVFAGTWTLEDFFSYRGIANKDLNGDGKYDNTDQYTYAAGDIRGIPSQFWQGCGINVITKDETDMPQIVIWDDQKYNDLIETLHTHLYTGENNISNITVDGGMGNSDAFLEGRVMIFPTVFTTINESRVMEDD